MPRRTRITKSLAPAKQRITSFFGTPAKKRIIDPNPIDWNSFGNQNVNKDDVTVNAGNVNTSKHSNKNNRNNINNENSSMDNNNNNDNNNEMDSKQQAPQHDQQLTEIERKDNCIYVYELVANTNLTPAKMMTLKLIISTINKSIELRKHRVSNVMCRVFG